ncbi:MAG: foldase protein PrsA, partial [Terriglobales bacterium]
MKRFAPLTAALAVVLAALPLAADTVIEEIVARINNQIISRSDFRRSRDQLHAEILQQNPSDGEHRFAGREPDILRDLIDQELLVQRGKDLGITADTEVIKRLDEIRKQLNLETMEELEKAATAQGVSFEDFKQNIRNNIITQQVIGREVGSRIQITQEEIRQYYEEHQAEMTQPEQVRLSEILVAPKAGEGRQASAEESLAAARSKAAQVLDSIHKGAKFEEAAKASSDGPTAAQGGDLGYFKRGTLAKELEDLAFGMKVGEVSDVIRTRQGYIVLQVTEHTQP